MCVCVCVCLCVCVCVYVCVLQALGRSRETMNGQIGLKFDTLKPWVNPWGNFSHFLKILIFGSWGSGSEP